VATEKRVHHSYRKGGRPKSDQPPTERPPPYRVFAHALKDVMPRKRSDKLIEGKRTTAIYYRVPDPAAAVVDLALEKSRRAIV
jgi:hypothetical protein